MKEFCLMGMLLVFCLAGCGTKAENFTKTMVRRGLPAKVTIKVHDPDGNPIPDASVMFVFTFADKEKTNDVIGKTDTNGMATAEGRGNDKVVIHVNKSGWYKPYGDYSLWGQDKSYQSGRWEPWDPILDITLYPKKHPRRNGRDFKMGVYEHLEQDTAYGFDMLKKDIVLPGKKDEVVDFHFEGNGSKVRIISELPGESKLFSTNNFEIAFLNEGDGVVRKSVNKDSEFRFSYLAPETGYEQSVKFSSITIPQHRESTFLTDGEYLIFRISRKDLDSGKINRYYGIITRLKSSVNTKGERYFDIWYYLNPDPEDRNIEY